MAIDSIISGFSGTQILQRTPADLRSLLASATTADLEWQPSADRWSISMVLAHLADVEVKGFQSRFHAIAEQDNPLLPSYDQMALFRSSSKFDTRQELQRFEQERRTTLAYLESVPSSVAARTGRHEELGALSFQQLLNEFAFHDLGHIRQIMELFRAHVFYPQMGVFMNYYRVNP